MSDIKPHPLLRADGEAVAQEVCVRHPLNPKAKVYLKALSRAVGMERVHLWVARLPPGHESFMFHSHMTEEEFLYILSGRGRAEIGDEVFEIGPGDYMGFATPSLPHNLSNPYDEDLVYLMGGEKRPLEIGEFPRHGKWIVSRGDEIFFVDAAAVERRSIADFIDMGDDGEME